MMEDPHKRSIHTILDKNFDEDHIRKKQKEEKPQPIAELTYHVRYWEKNGAGALKYDLVEVKCIIDRAKCRELHRNRGGDGVMVETEVIIHPAPNHTKGKKGKDHKIMVVPSIGCPKELSEDHILQRLLWAKYGYTRPTVLLVHDSEVEDYRGVIEHIANKYKVGLVRWKAAHRVGFGLSRLAAMTYAGNSKTQRDRVILCDVNVSAFSLRGKTGANIKLTRSTKKKPDVAEENTELLKGYDTDEQEDSDMEEEKPGRLDRKIYGMGFGTGVALYSVTDDGRLVSTGASQGGDGRPVEQVVCVRSEVHYDPCFITSSEDFDIETSARDLTGIWPLKLQSGIEKIQFTVKPKHYEKIREQYLRELDKEGEVYVLFNPHGGGEQQLITVNALAELYKKRFGGCELILRSLIIEKILLKYKHEAHKDQ